MAQQMEIGPEQVLEKRQIGTLNGIPVVRNCL